MQGWTFFFDNLPVYLSAAHHHVSNIVPQISARSLIRFFFFVSLCVYKSLLVAFMQALEQLVHQLRRNDRGGMFLCIIECILHYTQHIAKYFNKVSLMLSLLWLADASKL